jgi:hypothetical protein
MATYRDFIEYAEHFHQQAEDAPQRRLSAANVVSSILLAWIGLESFVNDMLEDFASVPADLFALHESAFLQERAVSFGTKGRRAGEFFISNHSDFKRLEDKILFLVARFGRGERIKKGSTLWQQFEKAKEKRNFITHPRRGGQLMFTPKDSRLAIDVSKSVITLLAQKIWRKNIRF